MSASVKKIGAAVVFLLAAAALAGYFVFIPQQEKKYEQDIAAFIEALPGDLAADSIKVDFLGNSAEIRGLRGTTNYIMDSDLRLDIASLTLAGLNFNLGQKAGIDTLADSLICSNGSMKTTTVVEGLDQPITQDIVFSSIELHNMKGDFSTVRELFGDAPLERKLDIATTFSAGPMRIKGYANTTSTVMGSLNASLDSCEVEQYSLLSVRNAVWEKMRCSAMDMEFMAVDRMSLASMKMPNILASLFAAMEAEDPDAMGDAVLDKIDETPIEIHGMVMEGFRLRLPPMTPEAISIKRLDMDLEASTGRLIVKKNMEGFILPPSIYGNTSVEAAQFSAYYQKPLEIDARLDLELALKSGAPTEVLLKDLSVQDKNLASARLRAEMLNAVPMTSVYGVLSDSAMNALVMKKGELVLEDTALLETFFQAEIAAHEEEQPQEGQVRQSVADLRENAARFVLDQTPDGKTATALAEGLAKLLRAPGTLLAACNPASPFSLSTFSPDTLDNLGITVDFTQAHQGVSPDNPSAQ